MRALGKRLNSAATAVYWHVKNKDNLVLLASDQVWDEIKLPDLGAVDWRTAATSMAGDLYAMLTRHPWLVQAFTSHTLYGVGKARHDDHNLAVYEAAGFTGAKPTGPQPPSSPTYWATPSAHPPQPHSRAGWAATAATPKSSSGRP